MPMVDGKAVRARYTSLKLNELSSVDRPAQPGAVATIMKRDGGPAPTAPKASWLAREIAKYVDEDDGAHTFNEVLSANNFDEKIWPMVSALSQSIRSIMGDSAVSTADRQTKVQASVDEFLAAVRALEPPADPAADTPATTVEKQLRELISKKEETMPKSVAELVAENPALKAHLDAIEGERDTAKAALATEQTAHGETKKALGEATEETIEVGGQTIKRSEVGAASFNVAKAMRDERDMAVLEKRASEEFGHLPGTTTEKAAVLKSVEALPEDTKKAAIAIFTAAEKMATSGFGRIGVGTGNGDLTPTAKAAETTFLGKVAEIRKRDNIQEFEAMRKARDEFPAEFEAYQEATEAA